MLNERTTPCECAEPGFCERHRCFKSRPFFEFCRTSLKVFRLYEERRGPGQHASSAARDGVAASCLHRGPEIRRQQCPTCNGHVDIKVFGCAVHAECSIVALPEVHCCQGCPEFESAPRPLTTEH